ncbi:MAG: hypothetical protein NC489_37110 [Ruminococcus flavefaciens]|nr:hypothetical protein [Ruminococcus flavefaciens]
MSDTRKEMIQTCIKGRKEKDELAPCIFYISPADIRKGVYDNPTVQKVSSILNKYHISHGFCDTVLGSYNLNRDWIETDVINCAIEYCGAYPADWDIEDIMTLEDMEYSGEILIQVVWKVEDKYELNH